MMKGNSSPISRHTNQTKELLEHCMHQHTSLPKICHTTRGSFHLKFLGIYQGKRSCVGKTILAELKSAPVPFKTCADFPLDYLLKLFLQMKIYCSLKFASRDFTSTKKKVQEIYTLRSHICNQVNSITF